MTITISTKPENKKHGHLPNAAAISKAVFRRRLGASTKSYHVQVLIPGRDMECWKPNVTMTITATRVSADLTAALQYHSNRNSNSNNSSVSIDLAAALKYKYTYSPSTNMLQIKILYEY